MKFRKFAWLFGALALAACESSRMVSGPTMDPPESAGPGAWRNVLPWRANGTVVTIDTLWYVSTGAEVARRDLRIRGEGGFGWEDPASGSPPFAAYDPAAGGWSFDLNNYQVRLRSNGALGQCIRLTFYDGLTNRWTPWDRYRDLYGYTEGQRARLRVDQGNGAGPMAALLPTVENGVLVVRECGGLGRQVP